MDFERYTCPVCERPFVDGDDIVVCPECGAPHHRTCYEKENRCAFEDRHKDGFDYEEYYEATDPEAAAHSESVICPRCRAENEKGSFYCSKCGCPLGMNGQANPNQSQQGGIPPFGFGVNMNQNFDPMAGINPDEDWGDGVTAGEVSKFVQKNNLYFMRVFNKLKLTGKGRFNFCAFIISGGYLLYRKMYKLGAVVTGLMFSLMILETYIYYSPANTAFFNAVENIGNQSGGAFTSPYLNIYKAFFTLSTENQIWIGIMLLASVLQLMIQIIVGFNANRWYFKHCTSQISKLKSGENAEQSMEAKGGVNLPIAISMYAVYLVINYLPYFMGLGG